MERGREAHGARALANHEVRFDADLDALYCDCPGFLDNRGAEINIANACNIKQTIAQAASTSASLDLLIILTTAI